MESPPSSRRSDTPRPPATTEDPALILRAGGARARLLPGEGAVVDELSVDGTSVLARTPWADQVAWADQVTWADRVTRGAPAATEDEWVRRWRGGWQLCAPTAGAPEPGAHPRQYFHGAASQAPWRVLAHETARAVVEWSDDDVRITREWTLAPRSLTASTTLVQTGGRPRPLSVAEHLILGGDLFAPLSRGEGLRLETDAEVSPLGYDGSPTGAGTEAFGGRWSDFDAATPARLGALTPRGERRVIVRAGETSVEVTWTGLPHALLWEEAGASAGEPWNGQVFALGVEPTTTPHGIGSAAPEGVVELRPGQSLTWTTTLRVRPASRSAERPAP